MRAIVITPAIRKEGEWKKHMMPQRSGVLVLTNSLHQEVIFAKDEHGKGWISEVGLLDEERFEMINEQAKFFARHWFLEKETEEVLTYRGINLGALLVHPLTYYFVGVLKAIELYRGVIRRFGVEELCIVDDGTYWGEAGRWVARQGGIRAVTLNGRSPAFQGPAGFNLKAAIKNLVALFNRLKLRSIGSGGILYSCAPRYAFPFLEQGKGDYYLREVFSLEAFSFSREHPFFQLLPDYFKNGRREARTPFDLGSCLDKLRRVFDRQRFLHYEGKNLWPICQKDLERLLKGELSKAVERVEVFFKLLGRLNPRSVVVDEDVCLFNKALVECANQLGIPTYTIVHGAPYFEIGSVPPTAKFILVWGKSTKERLIQWGVSEDGILEVGAPQYEPLKNIRFSLPRQEVIRYMKIPEGAKIILLATQPFHTNERPDFLGSPLTPELVRKTVAVLMGACRAVPEVYGIVKLHPRDENQNFTESLLQEYPVGLRKRIRLVKNFSTPDLIAAADLVLTAGSTVYYEALLLRKPIAILDDPKKRFFGYMSPFFLALNDINKSCDVIKEMLTEAGARVRVKVQEEEIADHFCGNNEGARERVLELISRHGQKQHGAEECLHVN